jgi:hypothetical protein
MSRIIRPYPGFIIPTRRFVDVGMPQAGVTMTGKYRIRKFRAEDVRADGTVPEDAYSLDTGYFPNLILDSGLNRLGTGAIIAGAAIGTDNSTPSASQTGLLAQTAYTTTSGTGAATTALGSSPYNNTRTVVYRTALGDLNGNYSEVGVGWASGSMFSRALILNGGGTPTPISVTSAEQLDISYQLSVYPPLSDVTATVTISGVDYDVTGRASNVNTLTFQGFDPSAFVAGAMSVTSIASWQNVWTGGIGAITTTPSGTTSSEGTSALVGSYVNNSLERECQAAYSLTQGNVAGGIKSTRIFWRGASFQYEFDPVIPKDGTKSLSLNYKIYWARRP